MDLVMSHRIQSGSAFDPLMQILANYITYDCMEQFDWESWAVKNILKVGKTRGEYQQPK